MRAALAWADKGGDKRRRRARVLVPAQGFGLGGGGQWAVKPNKVYLDTWFTARSDDKEAPPVREGRRMRLFERVLEPARRRLGKQQWQRLQASLALTTGTEPMVIMKDVCRLGDKEAQEVLLWAAKVLLRAGLDEKHKPPAKPR